jgi:cysteine synthase A
MRTRHAAQGSAAPATPGPHARESCHESRPGSCHHRSNAERSGALQSGGTIVEPTSGNTGIGLAMVAAVKGCRLVLVMHDSMSVEGRGPMLATGATLELTPREQGTERLDRPRAGSGDQHPGAWMPQQFENPANVEVHVRTTAQEILADFPEGLDVLITGVGTGGHLSG